MEFLFKVDGEKDGKAEYISVEMNNNGGILVAIEVGFRPRENINLDINEVDLANGQQHVVNVKRSNRGRTLTIKVDDYEPKVHVWSGLTEDADTRLHNPKYIWFGRIDTMSPTDGLQGCLFRAQFDNVFPFKDLFQDPPPNNVVVSPRGELIKNS